MTHLTTEQLHNIIHLAESCYPEDHQSSVVNLDGTFEELLEETPEYAALVNAIRELGEQGVIELATIMYLGLNPDSHNGLQALQEDMSHRYTDDPDLFIVDIADKTPLKSYLQKGLEIYNAG